MTDEEYEIKYNKKTVKQLCNQWREHYIKEFKKWDDEKTIQMIKNFHDDEIIKLGLSKLLEEFNNDK